jgi:hypothetical protein
MGCVRGGDENQGVAYLVISGMPSYHTFRRVVREACGTTHSAKRRERSRTLCLLLTSLERFIAHGKLVSSRPGMGLVPGWASSRDPAS